MILGFFQTKNEENIRKAMKLLQSIMGLWTWIMGLAHVVSWTFFFT